ncbi:MAG: hypothetical protein WCG84_00390 [Candidatus Moraniibacteriota bacterium]
MSTEDKRNISVSWMDGKEWLNLAIEEKAAGQLREMAKFLDNESSEEKISTLGAAANNKKKAVELAFEIGSKAVLLKALREAVKNTDDVITIYLVAENQSGKRLQGVKVL